MVDATGTDPTAQSERGADPNRRALATDGALDPVLPSLDDGVTLLDVDGRGVPVLQSLVLDHLLSEPGPAFWVDTAGCARTTTLARVAPTWRLLERVQVARGFTPFQHHAAICDVPDAVDAHAAAATDDRAATNADVDGTDTPALLVAPVVDGRYRDADDLPREHARQLLARTLARLRRYADAYDAPVLLTRAGSGREPPRGSERASSVVENAIDHRLRCERTPQGPRFVGDETTETLVYPQADGTLQTTLAYWRTVLQQRARASGFQVGGPTPAPNASAKELESLGTGDPPGQVRHAAGALATDAGALDTGRGHGAAHERALSPWRNDA